MSLMFALSLPECRQMFPVLLVVVAPDSAGLGNAAYVRVETQRLYREGGVAFDRCLGHHLVQHDLAAAWKSFLERFNEE